MLINQKVKELNKKEGETRETNPIQAIKVTTNSNGEIMGHQQDAPRTQQIYIN